MPLKLCSLRLPSFMTSTQITGSQTAILLTTVTCLPGYISYLLISVYGLIHIYVCGFTYNIHTPWQYQVEIYSSLKNCIKASYLLSYIVTFSLCLFPVLLFEFADWQRKVPWSFTVNRRYNVEIFLHLACSVYGRKSKSLLFLLFSSTYSFVG